jgi:hypothetical protein
MNDYMKFPRGGKGRIFVEKEEDVFALRNIIKAKCYIDDLPQNLITVFSDENYASVPVEDFTCDIEPVLYEAWDNGIKCFCVFGDAIETDNRYMKFPHKKYGRVYVENEADILVLKGIMLALDSFEFDYLPIDLISVFEKGNLCYNKYVGKFDDMDMSKVLYCAWRLGIKCFCVFAHDDEWLETDMKQVDTTYYYPFCDESYWPTAYDAIQAMRKQYHRCGKIEVYQTYDDAKHIAENTVLDDETWIVIEIHVANGKASACVSPNDGNWVEDEVDDVLLKCFNVQSLNE